MKKIDKISPEVMEAINKVEKIKDKKLTIKQKYFINAYLKDNNGYKAAIKVYDIKTTDKKMLINVANQIARDNLQNPTIAATIEEVLTSNEITKDSTIKKHNLIIDKAIKIKQLSVAEKGNSRFMEMLGMTEKVAEGSTVINNLLQINIKEADKKQIDDTLMDIISK